MDAGSQVQDYAKYHHKMRQKATLAQDRPSQGRLAYPRPADPASQGPGSDLSPGPEPDQTQSPDSDPSPGPWGQTQAGLDPGSGLNPESRTQSLTRPGG